MFETPFILFIWPDELHYSLTKRSETNKLHVIEILSKQMEELSLFNSEVKILSNLFNAEIKINQNIFQNIRPIETGSY